MEIDNAQLQIGALPRAPARATRPLQTRGVAQREEGLRPSDPGKGAKPLCNPFFVVFAGLCEHQLKGDISTLDNWVTFLFCVDILFLQLPG